MNHYAFSEELFDARRDLISSLEASGLAILYDFGSVDILHDLHGLEITEIRNELTATKVCSVARQAHPYWKNIQIFYEPEDTSERGWKVLICRDRDLSIHFSGSWKELLFMAVSQTFKVLNRPLFLRQGKNKSDPTP